MSTESNAPRTSPRFASATKPQDAGEHQAAAASTSKAPKLKEASSPKSPKLQQNKPKTQHQHDENWIEGWELWTAFRAHNDSGNVPDDYADEKLVEWVEMMRDDYELFNKGEPSFLGPDGFNLMKRLGFVFERLKQAASEEEVLWDQRFEEFLSFTKNIHMGDNDLTEELTSWILEQQDEYKKHDEGRQSNLSGDQYQRLRYSEIPTFVVEDAKKESSKRKAGQGENDSSSKSKRRKLSGEYGISDAMQKHIAKKNFEWLENFEELKRYKRRHGHTCVPKACKDNPKLSRWVYNQRKFKRERDRGDPSSLDDDRLRKLESINFVWNTRISQEFRTHRYTELKSEQWEKNYARLVAYKKVHKDCLVPKMYPPDQTLASWVGRQRQQYRFLQEGKLNVMSPYRQKKLEEIGFVFNTKAPAMRRYCLVRGHNDKWDQHFKRLLDYVDKTGHPHVPRRFKTDQHLASFVQRQRQQHKLLVKGEFSCLTPERLKKLQDIGFCFDGREAKVARNEANSANLAASNESDATDSDSDASSEADDGDADEAKTSRLKRAPTDPKPRRTSLRGARAFSKVSVKQRPRKANPGASQAENIKSNKPRKGAASQNEEKDSPVNRRRNPARSTRGSSFAIADSPSGDSEISEGIDRTDTGAVDAGEEEIAEEIVTSKTSKQSASKQSRSSGAAGVPKTAKVAQKDNKSAETLEEDETSLLPKIPTQRARRTRRTVAYSSRKPTSLTTDKVKSQAIAEATKKVLPQNPETYKTASAVGAANQKVDSETRREKGGAVKQGGTSVILPENPETYKTTPAVGAAKQKVDSETSREKGGAVKKGGTSAIRHALLDSDDKSKAASKEAKKNVESETSREKSSAVKEGGTSIIRHALLDNGDMSKEKPAASKESKRKVPEKVPSDETAVDSVTGSVAASSTQDWICGVCGKGGFKNFVEASFHEARCSGFLLKEKP